MRAADALKHWTRLILKQGPSRLAIAVGVLFLLLALASPLWSFTFNGGGGDWSTRTYGWTTFTQEEYENGIWDRTIVQSYASPNFDDLSIAATMGATYWLTLVFLIVLAGAAFVLALPRFRTMGPLAHLGLSLAVIILGVIALFYPVVVLPGGLATDLAPLPVGGGYWGGPVATTTPNGELTWGAGLGWWALLVGFFLGSVGVALPYTQSVRSLNPPGPRTWHPGR